MYYITSFLILVYWLLLLLVLYVFFGYQFLLGFLYLFKKKAKQERPEYTPKISLVILAGNDRKTIARKLESSFLFEYPEDKLEIIVATIDSTDNTRKIVEDYFARGVKLLYQAEKAGRNQAINSCVSEAAGEVIVFTDGASVLEKFSLKNLARHFVDAKVGLVAGNTGYPASKDKLVLGEKFFAAHDRAVLINSSKLKKISRLNPELYAVRKAGFKELKDDGVQDLTSVPVSFSVSGMTCLFEPLAVAARAPVTDTREYFAHRAGLTIEALRSAAYLKELLRGKKYLTVVQVLSNNILYGASGVLLFLLFFFNLLVLVKPGYVFLLALQFLFYVAGALKLFGFFPYYVFFTSYASLAGLVKLLRKEVKDGKN